MTDETFYITGSNNTQYTLLNGNGGITTQNSQTLAKEINQKISDGNAVSYDAESYYNASDIPQDKETVSIFSRNTSVFGLKRWADYVVVSTFDQSTSQALLDNSSLGTSSNYIKILAGSSMQFSYVAGDESGEIINTGKSYTEQDNGGSLNFSAINRSGDWSIYSDSSNDNIVTSNGDNTIHAGLGNNTIVLGTGRNIVFSEGKDTISGSGAGYQSVTLTGTQSEVSLKNDQAYVMDVGDSNTISVGNNSTVAGGSNGKVTFNAGDQNIFSGGDSNTITTTNNSSLQVIHGSDNTYNVDKDLILLNSNNKTTITVNGALTAFGASNSSYIVNATGDVNGLFIADTGNETLNASGSTAALQIYANTISGAQTNFVAAGGAGNDILTAGTGNSTFSGGAGDNLFIFNKNTATNGQTVITDFAKSAHNVIGLYNYNLTQDSLTTLLQQSSNDALGNAILNLEGHTVTIQGVSVSNLNADQFVYTDANTNQNA